MLKKVQKIIGDGSIVLHQKRKDKNWKDSYKYNFTRKTLRALLPRLKLISKEKQRLLLIDALRIVSKNNYCGKPRTDHDENCLIKIWEEMRRLNNRGTNANLNNLERKK